MRSVERDVVDLVRAFRLRQRGQQVGLHGVFDEAEIAAGLAVAVDEHVIAADLAPIHLGMTAA